MKNKALIAVIAIVLIAVIAYFVFGNKLEEPGTANVGNQNVATTPATNTGVEKGIFETPKDLEIPKKSAGFTAKVADEATAKEIFTTLMNKMYGEDKWSAGGYSYDVKEALLTVKKFAKEDEKAKIEAEEIYIRSALTVEDINKFKEIDSWVNQPETEFFDFFGMKNFVISMAKVLDADPEVTETASVKVDKLYLTSLKLKKLPENFEGSNESSFFEAFYLGKSEALNTALNFSNAEMQMDLSLAYDSVKNIDFSGTSEKLKTKLSETTFIFPEEVKTLLACSLDYRVVRDLKANVKALTGKEANIDMKLESFELHNLESLLKGEKALLKNLVINGTVDDVQKVDFNFSIDSIDLKKYEMLNYLNQFVKNPNYEENLGFGAEDIFSLSQQQEGPSLADTFFAPVSLESYELKKMHFKVLDFELKLDELMQTGPSVASAPSNSEIALKNLVVSLPKKQPETYVEVMTEMYEFGQKFGMTDFVMNMTGSVKFDEATKNYSMNVENFDIKDLFKISSVFSLGGLNEENISSLQNYKILDFADKEKLDKMLIDLGSIVLNEYTVKFEDISLLDRMFSFAAEQQFQGMSKDDVRNMAVAGLAMGLTPELSKYIEEPNKVVESLKAFIQKPEEGKATSYEIKIHPNGLKISDIAVYAKEANSVALLNKLNINLKANNGEQVKIKFKEAIF